MKKIIVHHRSSHHASYSGYAQLINYLGDVEVVSGQHSILSKRLARIIKNNNSQIYGLYDSNSARKNEELLRKLLFSKKNDTLTHYLNGERDIRQALNWFHGKSKSVATFHKPPEILKATITDTKYLSKLDGAIAVGINQVDFLKNWLNTDNVRYIPHGVDTTFFKPDANRKQDRSLLFVGQHLRDFDALNYAIPRLIDKVPDLKIKAVLRKDYAHKILPHSSVKVFSGLDDENLKILYQEATLLFLPLKDVTACNSILEAMACGLPVVSTDVGGNLYYVKNGSGALVPANDYVGLIDATVSILENLDLQKQMNELARQNAMNFDWIAIGEQINEFYKDTISLNDGRN